jgi:hypothetical protein
MVSVFGGCPDRVHVSVRDGVPKVSLARDPARILPLSASTTHRPSPTNAPAHSRDFRIVVVSMKTRSQVPEILPSKSRDFYYIGLRFGRLNSD